MAGQRCGIAFVMAALACASHGQAPTIVLEERDFAAASVEFGFGGWGWVGTPTFRQNTTGGDPGSWGEFVVDVVGGIPPPQFPSGSTTFAYILLSGRPITPSSVGGIASVSIALSSRFLSSSGPGCNCSGQAVVLRQGGNLYLADMPPTNSSADWTASSATGLAASSFARVLFGDPSVLDPMQNPDFSAGGGPIELGLGRGNSNGPSVPYFAYSVATGVDNLVFTAKGCIVIDSHPWDRWVCPAGGASLEVAARGDGPLEYQWQIETSPGAWQPLGGQPVQLPCGGSASASPPNASAAVITIDGCTGDFRVRALVSSTCGATPSAAATLTVRAGGYANCNGSTTIPAVNALDFGCFLSRYVAAQSLSAGQQVADYANCDGSTSVPALNALDFSCFLARYRAGCP